jgi:hypothetical protein
MRKRLTLEWKGPKWELKEEDIRGGKDERKKEFKMRKEIREEELKKGQRIGQ